MSATMDFAKLEKFYQDYVNSMLQTGESPRNIATFQDFVANYAENQHAQASAPAPTPAVNLKDRVPLTEAAAAVRIQRAWRRHIDIQVYKYYRDLINFKQKGDPAMMMRSINPIEAKFMDSASGVHVKFRLAGEKFPPNIYYKIFTHRPVQDLCANSPKDYTQADSKLKDTRIIHNNTLQLNLPGDDKENKASAGHTGWYQRTENNGWRLVSDRMIAHLLCDPITWDTNNKRVDFHHNKSQRKLNLERRRKQRKVDWMRKMHADGLIKAKGSDPDTAHLVRHAADGMVESLAEHGVDAVEDWEVDELLEWTTALNFDDYLATWKEIATTAGSEDRIDAKTQLYFLPDDDPYTLTVSYPPQSLPKSGISYTTPVSTMAVEPGPRP